MFRHAPAVRDDVLDERALQRMDNRELDLLFRSSPAGDIPRGRLPGTGLLFPGTPVCPPLARLVHLLVWQGKETEASGRSLRNLVSPLRMRSIRALLSHDRSWVDGEECVLIDYSRTSVVARMVRDEIRLVAPGLYLGVVWLWRRRAGWFTLRQP
ncbi:hypothetical protein [Geodermatophilus sp. SYSU D01176]